MAFNNLIPMLSRELVGKEFEQNPESSAALVRSATDFSRDPMLICIKKGLYAFKQSSAHGPLQELSRADLERVENMYAAWNT